MRARQIVGKRIQRVVQKRESLGKGRRVTTNLVGIQFTDGSWLRFVVEEGDDEYGIYAIYPGRALDTSATVCESSARGATTTSGAGRGGHAGPRLEPGGTGAAGAGHG